MPLTMFVAMSVAQEAIFNRNGGVLTLAMFGSASRPGPSIPMKLTWQDAVENGNASPAAPMAIVISIEISEAKLAVALQQNVVQFGNWGYRPGCRWFCNYTIDRGTDWQCDASGDDPTAAARAIEDQHPALGAPALGQ